MKDKKKKSNKMRNASETDQKGNIKKTMREKMMKRLISILLALKILKMKGNVNCKILKKNITEIFNATDKRRLILFSNKFSLFKHSLPMLKGVYCSERCID